MKKMKILLIAFITIFCLNNALAQSHIADANYGCRLKPGSLNTEKGLCPACADNDKKEQDAKIAEEKRRFAEAQAAATAKKEAREKERLEKIEADKKNAESGKVYINGNNSANSTNTSTEQIPDDYKGNPLHYNNSNVSSGSGAVDDFNKGYQQGQQIINGATALYTNLMTNSSSGSSAVDSFTKGYAQGEQIVEVATALIDLFTPSPEQIRIREAEIQRIQAEAKKKELAEKAMWDNYTDIKYLEKEFADANNGDENARMLLIYEIHSKSYAKDITHFLPNVKNWVDEAVKNKNLEAMNFIGYYAIYELKKFKLLNYTKEEGLKILEEAVTLNSADAMFSLGEYYGKKREGNNPEKSFYFYLKAAELNHPVAMYRLGHIYLYKCISDYSPLFVKYKIEKNSNLGCTYIHNSLLCKDSQETLYQKYGLYGNKFLKFKVYKELASMYENGVGCPKDAAMAKTLYDESAKSLDDFSMKTVR